MKARLEAALERRFGRPAAIPEGLAGLDLLAGIAARGSCRTFGDKPVADDVLEFLAAVALSAPTKSDLQQRDIVILRDPDRQARLARLVGDQAWVAGAPHLLIFCGNNRRQRQLHDWRGHPFANDHLDAFFNAAVDAGIALATFVTAAEAAGLGCCPISAVRNEAEKVSELLGLPDHVFPVAGLAVGHPAAEPEISPRLPLSATVHVDRYDEAGIAETVEAYDRRREAIQPYARQRSADRFGTAPEYGWSEDKARQYALPERETFGRFVRGKGFRLD